MKKEKAQEGLFQIQVGSLKHETMKAKKQLEGQSMDIQLVNLDDPMNEFLDK